MSQLTSVASPMYQQEIRGRLDSDVRAGEREFESEKPDLPFSNWKQDKFNAIHSERYSKKNGGDPLKAKRYGRKDRSSKEPDYGTIDSDSEDDDTKSEMSTQRQAFLKEFNEEEQ